MVSQGSYLAYYAALWEAWLGIPAGEHSPEERRKFTDANNIFVGCVISVLVDRLVDVYMHITDAKEL